MYLKEIQNLRAKAELLKEKNKALEEEISLLVSQIEKTKEDSSILDEALLLAKACLEDHLKKKSYIENLNSEGLSSVFSEPYTLVLETQFDDNGLIKGIKPKLKAASGELDDPLSSFGGGSHVIINLCLRFAAILLTNKTAPLLVMDEPLANLAADLQPLIIKFLEELSRTSGIQLIMITHSPHPFGRVYKVVKKEGISKCLESN